MFPPISGRAQPAELCRRDSVGLKRRGFTIERSTTFSYLPHHILQQGHERIRALNYIEEKLPATDEQDDIVTFIRGKRQGVSSKRFARKHRGMNDADY